MHVAQDLVKLVYTVTAQQKPSMFASFICICKNGCNILIGGPIFDYFTLKCSLVTSNFITFQ